MADLQDDLADVLNFFGGCAHALGDSLDPVLIHAGSEPGMDIDAACGAALTAAMLRVVVERSGSMSPASMFHLGAKIFRVTAVPEAHTELMRGLAELAASHSQVVQNGFVALATAAPAGRA